MPELPPEKLQTFGKAVKAARVLKGMTLDQAAYKSLGRDNAKGYFSQIENGKRQITPRTAGKIITALEMDPALLEPFLGEGEIAEDEVTKADIDAEKLITKARADNADVVTGERLLIDLAYEFAQGEHRDLFSAYKGLRAALEAARELKARGNLPQNTSSQLNAVLRRVSELNEEGDREGAADCLAAEEKRLEAESEALFDAQLKQDRIRNRPDLAAKRLYKDTARKAHENGEKRFIAIDELAEKWSDEGDKSGDLFTLRVALELAKANNDATKRKYAAFALGTVGCCQLTLGERSPNEQLLNAARASLQAALRKTNREAHPILWANCQRQLAITLMEIGRRNGDIAVLNESVSLFRALMENPDKLPPNQLMEIWDNLGDALRTLGEITADPAPLKEAVIGLTFVMSLADRLDLSKGWLQTQNKLGVALRWLGAITEDLDMLNQARETFRECEACVDREDRPMHSAVIQWNIADLAFTRFLLDPDPALMDEAQEYVTLAREFFVLGSEYHTQRCDELIARIEAVE